MSKQTEALKLADELDAEFAQGRISNHTGRKAAQFIREALAKQPAQQQKPLFWYRPCSNGMYEGPIHDAQIESVRKESGAWHPLYASPPAQRTWVGLTEEEVDDLSREMVKGNKSVNCLAHAIETKLKGKNT